MIDQLTEHDRIELLARAQDAWDRAPQNTMRAVFEWRGKNYVRRHVPRQAGVTLTRDGTDGTVPEADSLQSLNKRGVAHDGTRGSAPSTVCHVRQTVPSPSRARCIAR